MYSGTSIDTLANVPFTYTNEPESPRISTYLFALSVSLEQILYKRGTSYKYLPTKSTSRFGLCLLYMHNSYAISP